MPHTLLSSKITIPHHSPTLIERTQLFDLFDQHIHVKVTILRAPAGYGKTSILSSWLKIKEEAIAWVSLDTADNDPIRFWTYVLHAIARAYSNQIDQVLAPLLNTQDPATLEFFIHSLLEEINTTEQPIYIVLDDYHLIDNPIIHQLMSQFIEYLPCHVHIYVSTRSVPPLPIAKWRVKQWAHEFHPGHLRFTFQEAKRFFSFKHTASLTHQQLQNILDKTEGWVAGLLLMSLANENEIESLEESAQPFISEFLWQEIIHNLPHETQAFLLRTSLLHELDPTICDQLTKQTNSRELLENLEAKGLFTIRLQSNKPVFRYHHLLAEALQMELSRQYSIQEIHALVLETAQFIYHQGDYISAIELALKHEQYEQAAPWITEHLVQLYLSGQTATFMRWLHQLRQAQYSASYEMLVIGFLTAISAMEVETASSLMQELEVRQLTEHWMEQEEHAAMTYIYESAKAFALVASGGDLRLVEEIMRKQLAKGTISSRWDHVPIPYNSFEYKLLRTSIGSKGKLQLLEEGAVISELFRETSLQSANVTAFSYGVAAESLYERNILEWAQKELEIAIKLGHQLKDSGLFIPMYLLKAKIYVQQNQISSALAMLGQLLEDVSEKHWRTSVQIMQAYCYILNGDIQQADLILQATKTKQPFWLLVHARLLLVKELPNEALTTIIQVKTKAQQEEQIATIVEATVLEAICHQRLGNQEIALEILHEAFKLGVKFYYVRTFLDEKDVLPLLDSYFEQLGQKWDMIPTDYFTYLQKGTKINVTSTEILTQREKEIYDLLVEGVTNREIAKQLHLSEGTVRVYLSTIYSKLGVNSRAKAITLKNQQ
ncbi:LuxR C-terminal-related transcriptional regulator [Lysinibacillus cavernae]|uniref:LuxR C-terminal-related transcriptional regulator n=1 Tax=Lysinibacillus cavernae TaxID=2666135 RepID=UPI0012D90497|nr:LuxR C-terminal-related transcriptional regulator [Lysinibacillus cavernae]